VDWEGVCVSGVAYTDFATYYFPSQSLVGSAAYLWIGTGRGCQCGPSDKRLCVCGRLCRPSRGVTQDFDQDLLVRMFSSHLRILCWGVTRIRGLSLPMNALENLRALSLCSDNMSSSIKELLSSAPRLSHLHLMVNGNGPHLLSERIESLSLSYLSLDVTRFDAPTQTAFIPWFLPRVHTFRLSGVVYIDQQAGLKAFLSRHRDSLVELEICNLRDPEDSYGIKLMILPTLWEVCPNIRVIGMDRTKIQTLINTPKSDWDARSTLIPPLTLIMREYSSSWEYDLTILAEIKERLTLEKVVYTETWTQLDLWDRLISKAEVDMRDRGPRSRVDKLVKRLEKMDLLIVDKYGVPRSCFLRYPDSSNDVELEDHSPKAFRGCYTALHPTISDLTLTSEPPSRLLRFRYVLSSVVRSCHLRLRSCPFYLPL
jgi:hypothetical protein